MGNILKKLIISILIVLPNKKDFDVKQVNIHIPKILN